jgi:RNA polymerase sigma factor (sigma-70 family)
LPPAEQKTDKELIMLCLNGHDGGYTGLYNRYARKVYNSINRIVSHTGEAEDILQDTFCAVFSDVEKLESVLNIEAWVKRVAINRSLSHLRKKKILFSDLGEMDLEDVEEDPQEMEILDCRVDDLRKSIEALSSGYRTVVNLHVFEKLTHEEIAVMLDLAATTVRTQYHRAKKKILLSLKDKCYYE